MSRYKHTLVLVCPEAKMYDGNHLAACWGEQHPKGNLETFPEVNRPRGESWVSVTKTVCTPDLIEGAAYKPERHPDDTEKLTDMEAATRAHGDLMIVQRPAEGEDWPEFPEDKIIAFVDVPLIEVESLMGLERTENDDPAGVD